VNQNQGIALEINSLLVDHPGMIPMKQLEERNIYSLAVETATDVLGV
jgi:hypothetical protein